MDDDLIKLKDIFQFLNRIDIHISLAKQENDLIIIKLTELKNNEFLKELYKDMMNNTKHHINKLLEIKQKCINQIEELKQKKGIRINEHKSNIRNS